MTLTLPKSRVYSCYYTRASVDRKREILLREWAQLTYLYLVREDFFLRWSSVRRDSEGEELCACLAFCTSAGRSVGCGVGNRLPAFPFEQVAAAGGTYTQSSVVERT